MKHRVFDLIITTVFLLLFLSGPVFAADTLHHQIKLKLVPDTSQLVVENRISLPYATARKGELYFLLHGDLSVKAVDVILEKQVLSLPAFTKMAEHADVPLAQYRVKLKEGAESLQLQYQGKIHHVIKGPGEEYARSFSETPGIISNEGVFLADSSAWFPR